MGHFKEGFNFPLWFITKEYGEIPKLDNASIEEANKKEKERELAYKAKWAEEHKNNSNIETSSKEMLNNSLDETIELSRQMAEEKSTRQNNIIKKYYPEEYKRVSEAINEYYNNLLIIDLKNSPLFESEKELYDLALNILENENLSNEDETLLKDFIQGQMYNIKKDSILKSRADKILE